MNLAQRSFISGELAPSLYARTDLQKYQSGLRTCRNFLIQRHGGVANRPGTLFVREAKDSSNPIRPIPFYVDDDSGYVLEFGDLTLRFVRNGESVEVSGVSAWADATDYEVGDLVSRSSVNYYCISDHTSATATDGPGTGSAWQTRWYALSGSTYEIPSPYAVGDLSGLQFAQSGDVMTIVHPSYAPRELTRTSDTHWVLSQITFGPAIDSPTNLALSGGAVGTIRYWAVTAIDEETSEESLPSVVSATDSVPEAADPVTVSWNTVSGASRYKVYRSTDGSTYGYVATTGGTPIDEEDTAWTTTTSTVSESSAPGSGVWEQASDQCRNPLASISVTNRAYNEQYVIEAQLTVTLVTSEASDVVAGRVRAFYSRDSETRVDAGVVGNLVTFSGDGEAGGMPISGAIEVPDNGYTTLTIDLVAEVSGTGSGTTYGAAVSTASSGISWQYMIPSYEDVGGTADTAITPPSHPSLFDSADRYPSTVTSYQQRLVFANTNTNPDKVWASRSTSAKDFSTSNPLLDSDAVTFRLVGRQTRKVRHLLDVGRLAAATSSGILVIEGEPAAGILRPGEINPRTFSEHGVAASPTPLIVGQTVLYVQARGSIVRDFFPVQTDIYEGTDLTVFSAHLFDGHTIVDWAYQETPHSVVWCVRDDGVLLSLTYLREFGIWGWARHDTDGTVENVCVIPEGTEDALYLVVKRTIDGSDVRYVERLSNRFYGSSLEDAVFMDSAVTYDGVATTSITGLDHLEGEDVSVLADGEVVSSPNNPQYDTLTVSSGAITLPASASVVHVGLPFVSDITTLDIDTASGPSFKADKKVIVNEVTLVVEKASGLWVGSEEPSTDAIDTDLFFEPRLRDLEDWDDPTETLTGDVKVKVNGRFNTSGRITVRQVDPLPMTILAAIPQGSIG